MSFQLWEIVGGQGIWQQYKNSVTGELSIKTHDPKLVSKACTNHYWVEQGQTRNLKCRKCGFGKRYVLGVQKVIDGQLVTIKK